jgi:hypothetical protein
MDAEQLDRVLSECSQATRHAMRHAIEHAMTARVYGRTKLPLYGREAAPMLRNVAAIMQGETRECTDGFTWDCPPRRYCMLMRQQQWVLTHEITALTVEEAAHLTQEQITHLQATAPGVHIDSVRRILAATAATDLPLVPFWECDSLEWAVHRLAMIAFIRDLPKWSTRSWRLGRQAYTWEFNGNEYEIYEDRERRQYRIRLKPRVPYEQIVDSAVRRDSMKGALLRLIMLHTVFIAERDVPRNDWRALERAAARRHMLRVIDIVLGCPPRVQHWHFIFDKEITHRQKLFGGLARVMAGGPPSDWHESPTRFSWRLSATARLSFDLLPETGRWVFGYTL